MLPCSPHLQTRWLCCALGLLPSAKRMHLPRVGHRLEKRLRGPMHLFALGLPMVVLSMELLHHPLVLVPNRRHHPFQELVQFSRHSLVTRPESCEQLTRMLSQLRPNRRQQLTRIPKDASEHRDPVLKVSPKLIRHLLKIFRDIHSEFHLCHPLSLNFSSLALPRTFWTPMNEKVRGKTIRTFFSTDTLCSRGETDRFGILQVGLNRRNHDPRFDAEKLNSDERASHPSIDHEPLVENAV